MLFLQRLLFIKLNPLFRSKLLLTTLWLADRLINVTWWYSVSCRLQYNSVDFPNNWDLRNFYGVFTLRHKINLLINKPSLVIYIDSTFIYLHFKFTVQGTILVERLQYQQNKYAIFPNIQIRFDTFYCSVVTSFKQKATKNKWLVCPVLSKPFVTEYFVFTEPLGGVWASNNEFMNVK